MYQHYLIFISLIPIYTSLLFGFRTNITHKTIDSSFNGINITITLYWSGVQYQCTTYLVEETNYYLCNTLNINSTYECKLNQPASFQYGLLISNVQNNSFEIEQIIVNDTNVSSVFVIDRFSWNNKSIQHSFNSLQFSDYLLVQFHIQTKQIGHLYSFNRSEVISLQCIVSDIDDISDKVCIFGSLNSFLDGIYEYMFWDPVTKGIIYYNFKNKQYLIPSISYKYFIWYIGSYSYSLSYCNHGSNLGNDFIFNINSCTYWVTGADRITDTTMVSNNYVSDRSVKASVVFGFKTSVLQNTTSKPIIKLTLYWQYIAYQCIVRPDKLDEYYLCNTLSETTTYQCNIQHHNHNNNIQYGLQMDNDRKENIGIDNIIIKYKNTDISEATNILSYDFEDTIITGNSNKLVEFDLSNYSVISPIVESAICIPYIGQHKLNDALYDICVSGSILSVDGIYKYSFWNLELDSPIYFNKEYNVYLYLIIDEIDGYTWQLGSDPLLSGAWSYCIVNNYTFNVANCNEWLSWNNREWHIDSEISVKKCNPINSTKSIIFGFETPSSTQTSSNTVTLTLFWDGLSFECTQIPKLSNTYYSCNTDKSIKCDTTKLSLYKHVLQVSVSEMDNSQIDVIGIDNVIIKIMEGNVIQNTYKFENFCVSNDINSTDGCILFDIITLTEQYPTNLIVFSDLNDIRCHVYNQLKPAECKSDPSTSRERQNSDLMVITIIIIISTITFFCVSIISFCIISAKNKKNKDNYNLFITNGLVVNIAIGQYNKIIGSSADILNASLKDLPVEKDIENITELFDMLNYKIIPETLKLYWTENEILNYLKFDVINELFDNQNQLQYDGLIVCISCHGLENKIITSDYKTIEKNVLHRIISQTNVKTRSIPRLFMFDSCSGDGQREHIRASTVCIADMETDKSKLMKDLHEQNKGTSLNDISNGMEWTIDTCNPDFRLAIIHASNPGFQAKLDSRTGSYLLYNFTQKIKENIKQNENKTLSTIFEEIQNELHDRGKQQPQMCFNNHTGHLRFKINTSVLNHARTTMVATKSD